MMQEWGVMLSLLEGIVSTHYLELFCMDTLFLLPIYLPLNQLFMSEWTHGFLFSTLGYNPVLL